MDEAPGYAFPHTDADEARRLALLEERLDPLTKHRIKRLGVGSGARCLEIGGGRGSITRWLAELVGPTGKVTATDLQVGLLSTIDAPNVEVVRHDVLTDPFPAGAFDLIHTRAVLMHLPDDPALLPRMRSWLAPGGWLLLEEPDFGLWLADLDPLWSSQPEVWRKTFPNGSLSRGRSLLKQICQLDLVDIGADGEVDIVQTGTALSEFHGLSFAAIATPAVQAGALDAEKVRDYVGRAARDGFLGCGFVHIGVWGRRPG